MPQKYETDKKNIITREELENIRNEKRRKNNWIKYKKRTNKLRSITERRTTGTV
jgi:hypothetical protein